MWCVNTTKVYFVITQLHDTTELLRKLGFSFSKSFLENSVLFYLNKYFELIFIFLILKYRITGSCKDSAVRSRVAFIQVLPMITS